MPVPTVCCNCGGESCGITLCFTPSCIEPALEDTPLSEFTVTVTRDGETVGTGTLEPGHNCFAFDVAGTYHWTVRRGEQSRTGEVKLTCGSSKTIYVSLFDFGYSVRVHVGTCHDMNPEGLTVTYTDGNTTLTAVTAIHGSDTTIYALFENLPDPHPVGKPFHWTVTVPAQCHFQERVITGTFSVVCGSVYDVSVGLIPEPDYLCDDCIHPYPCSETLTLTGVFGTHALSLCGYFGVNENHPVWYGSEQRTVDYDTYTILYAFGCRTLVVWIGFNVTGEAPCNLSGSWLALTAIHHDPLVDDCESGCHATGWIEADPTGHNLFFSGLAGDWEVQ